jgi:HSP20 family protein
VVCAREQEKTMMSITRWDPVADAIGLRQVMDSLLEQSFVRPRDDGGGGALGLAVDVDDRGDAFVVEAAIPGSAPEDVEISVTGDVIRIRAERRDTREEGDPSGRFLVREQRFGAFERVLRLPAPVDAGAAQAEFQDGVLRITLPKTQQSREQRIPVRAGSNQADQQQDQAAETGDASQGNRGADRQSA